MDEISFADMNSLIHEIYEIHSLQEQMKQAEKSRVAILASEARAIYSRCLQSFDTIQRESNFAVAPRLRDHSEGLVALAEAALFVEDFSSARRLLVSFFQLGPQKDQFYCRAKIAMARVLQVEAEDLKGKELVDAGLRAFREIAQAVEIATAPSNLTRYKFVVYNASVAAWKIVRPFLRTGRARHFAQVFLPLVNAFDQQNDADIDWRVQLLSAAALCWEDAQDGKQAADVVDRAVLLATQQLTKTRSELATIEKDLQDCKKEVEEVMNAFRAIEEREERLRKPRKIDPDLPPDDPYITAPLELPALEGLASEGRERVKDRLDASQLKRTTAEQRMRKVAECQIAQSEAVLLLHRLRVAVFPSDGRKYASAPAIAGDLRYFVLVNLQCLLSGAVGEKEIESVWNGMIKRLEDSPSNLREETLLDLCRAAWYLKQPAIAIKCQTLYEGSTATVSQILKVKHDTILALRNVHELEPSAVRASQQMVLTQRQVEGLRVKRRVEVARQLERSLSMALVAARDRFLVLELSLLLWNTILPLLSARLRPKVHAVLKTLCLALEATAQDSLPELRARLHFELSLCEEAADFASLALTEAKRAFSQDYGQLGAYPSPADRNTSLDLNRPMDQELTPWIASLALRIDVFASPPEPESQAFLWIQQAREATAKAFAREALTKAALLLYDYCNDSVSAQTRENIKNGIAVDWGLVLMKRGPLNIEAVPLKELESVLEEISNSTQPPATAQAFSYAVQRRHRLLVFLMKEAHRLEDVNIVQRCAFLLLQTRWNVMESFAEEFFDDQVEAACLLAESFSLRIQIAARESQKKAFEATKVKTAEKSQEEDEEAKEGYAALGIRKGSEEVVWMKRLVLRALEAALVLARSRRDAYLVSNVLIFFWNLHLHIFRSQRYSETLDQLFNTLQIACQAAEEMIGFAEASVCCDLRLFVSLFDALSSYYESQGNLEKALETALRGHNLPCPVPTPSSSAAAFLKKALVEHASKLQVLQASKAAAGGGGGGKSKGGAALCEPLAVPTNTLLGVFASLAVAELVPEEAALPVEVVAEALVRAQRLLAEVQTQIEDEEKQEKQSGVCRTKEAIDQRLELQIEAWARLARLQVLRGEFVAGQDAANQGVTLFKGHLRKSDNVHKSGVEDDEDDLEEESAHLLEQEGEVGVRLYRWAALCEQQSALALLAFLEHSRSKSAAFDPVLVAQLQIVALQHAATSMRYAVAQGEEGDGRLVHRALALCLSLLPPLLRTQGEIQRRAFSLGLQCIADVRGSSLTRESQRLLRDLFRDLSALLLRRHDYETALQLLLRAFDQIDSSLHRDLWPARVICMSRRGGGGGAQPKDGLQQLKESDPAQQASVLLLFARATPLLGPRIATYLQAAELLEGRVERADYLLELAEQIASEGLPRRAVRDVLRAALDAYCAIEERRFEDVRELEEEDLEEIQRGTSIRRSSSGGGGVGVGSRSVSSAGRSRNNPSSSSRAGSRSGSAISGKPEYVRPQELDFKALEQSARLYIMTMQTETLWTARLACMQGALYYIRRAMQLWSETIAGTATTVATDGSLSEATSPPAQPLAFLSWPTKQALDFCNRTVTIPRSTKDVARRVPSLHSLPAIGATAFYLLTLVMALEEFGSEADAAFVLAFLRLLLTAYLRALQEKNETKGSAEDKGENDEEGAFGAWGSAEDVLPVLALCQLRAVHLLQRFGQPADQLPCFLPPPHSLGSIMEAYVTKYARDHVHAQEDLSSDRLYDVSYEDLLSAKRSSAQPQPPSLFLPTCPFHFASPQRLEVGYYWAHVSDLLVELGQLPVAQRMALTVQQVSCEQSALRLLGEARLVLLETQLLDGRTTEAMSGLLKLRDLLEIVGDPQLLVKQGRLLLEAQRQEGQWRDAQEALDLLFCLLEDLAVRRSTVANEKAMEKTEKPTTTTSGNPRQQEQEVGFEYLRAIKDVSLLSADLFRYMLCEVIRGPRSLSSPREAFESLGKRLSRVRQLLIEHVGRECRWLLELTRARSDAFAVLLRAFYWDGGGMDSDWMHNELVAMMEETQEAIHRVRSSLALSASSPDSSTQTDAVDIGKASEILSFQAQQLLEATAFKKVPSASAASADCIIARELVPVQLMHASQLFWLYLCDSKDTLLPSIQRQQERGEDVANPVEEFLRVTAPPTRYAQDAFEAPPLTRCLHISSAALLALKGNTSSPSLLCFGQLLFLCAQVLQAVECKHFSSEWKETKRLAQDWLEALESVLCSVVEQGLEKDGRIAFLLPWACVILFSAARQSGEALTATGCRALILLQSLQMSGWLRGVWESALPRRCEVACSLRRVERLHHSHPCDADDLRASAVYRAEKSFLESASLAVSKLSCAARVDGIIDSLSSSRVTLNAAVLCLQTDPWQRSFYATLLLPQTDTAAAPTAAGRGGKTDKAAAAAAAAVTSSVAYKRLIDQMPLLGDDVRKVRILVEQHRQWREDVTKFASQFGFELSEEAILDNRQQAGDLPPGTVSQKAERALEERMRALLEDLEMIVSPLLGPQSVLGNALLSQSSAQSPNQQQLFLVVDSFLQTLPWEGLAIFDKESLAISREFSLHFLHHRLLANSSFSSSSAISAASVKYVADPWQDEEKSAVAVKSIGQSLRSLLAAQQGGAGLPGGSKWSLLKSPENGLLCAEDFLLAFQSSSMASGSNKVPLALLSFSLGRLGSLLSASDVSPANLDRLAVFIVLDSSHNDISYRRQVSLDVLKSPQDMELEAPLIMAALLSLAGVGCLVQQMWSTPYPSQRRWIATVLPGWTKEGQSLGAALKRTAFYPVPVKKWIRLATVVTGLGGQFYQET